MYCGKCGFLNSGDNNFCSKCGNPLYVSTASIAAQPEHHHHSTLDIKMDLSMAKLKHMSWRIRIRDFLDGKTVLTRAEAVSHTDCDFGKWLYSAGLREYSSIPEMKDVEAEHRQLHALVHSIIDDKNTGNVAKAEEDYRSLSNTSNKVIELIDRILVKVTAE